MRTFYRLKKEIGLQALELNNHQCGNCGATSNLCVHHDVPMKPGDARYNDVTNLLVLCRPCHMAHHRRAGDIVTSGGRRGKAPPVKCSEAGCENLQHGKGLCKNHYAKAFRKIQNW